MSVRGSVAPAAVAIALLAGCTPAAGDAGAATPVFVPASPSKSAAAAPEPRPEKITYPAQGAEAFTAAEGEPAGERQGTLLRYRVLVEKDIKGISAGTFADAVRTTLADPRGWTAGGDLSFRRVGRGRPHDFTVYLVTPGTRDVLCQDAGDGYTSCRNGDKVVLNVARWANGVPGYRAGLRVYRQYLVNHEVGHRLGHGHELCPGKGRPAPVMQQQTLGMHGCTPNSWPYRDGERYAGASGAYEDEVPPREGASKP
ncbi:DUF3152 domain-containing protein [Couchioplanes caeruleus]|uniref:DUF3152 domain-containing protein n=2 Tax=Couchioplanes caeruleus TaxID=56438 RepID=A0A1K0GVM6_9ACTN|nr:DUF3152 domain-containing protein [Couchioplanes caeruleus]OJF15436.1 hypothetical protein BG844_04180 [Couchioplanes caeruleus subsp. caeruleus]ROP27482.1 uncharacterized protein DUF3152 [Couchioplanes caeruleus]